LSENMDGTELKVVNGHVVGYEGDMDMTFRTFASSFALRDPEVNKQQLLFDCKRAMTARAATKGDATGLSSGATFWLPAHQAPQCGLEVLVKGVFDYHTRNVTQLDTNMSGAEWWTLSINPRDEVGFHFDKDYGAEASGINLHPQISTVTYLVNHGAPTLVLGTRTPPMYGGDFSNTAVQRAWLCRPQYSRHMCFDGR